MHIEMVSGSSRKEVTDRINELVVNFNNPTTGYPEFLYSTALDLDGRMIHSVLIILPGKPG